MSIKEELSVSEELEMKILVLLGKMSSEIDNLKLEVESLKKQMRSPHSEHEHEKLSLTTARDYLKKQIGNAFPSFKFTHGNRATGTKFIIIDDDNNEITSLIRISKSHRDKEGYASGWFTVDEDTISFNPIAFFLVEDFEGLYHTLVIPRNELKNWASQKKVDSNGRLHFYVNLINGQWIDDRDGLNYNCSRFYENWNLIKNVIFTPL
jgi:hypothetical protein